MMPKRVTLFALVVAVLVLPVKTVFADCNPGRTPNSTNYLAGFYRKPGTTAGGVYSYLLNYSPYTVSDSFSTGWVGLYKDALLETEIEYIQLGWFEDRAEPSRRWGFFQWSKAGPGFQEDYFTPPAVNTKSYYTLVYNETPGHFTMYVQLQPGVNTKLTREIPAIFVPDGSQVYGEIKNSAAQMPGGYGNWMVFQDTHIYFNGAWNTFSGTVTNDRPDWFGSWPLGPRPTTSPLHL